MKILFAVTRTKGPAWDDSKPLQSQHQWTEHAAFMNGLAARGLVILGGPLADSGDALLIFNAPDEQAIHDALSPDPWQGSLLTTRSIQRWTILLQPPE